MINIYSGVRGDSIFYRPSFFNLEAERLVESLVANFYCNFDLTFGEACENAKLALDEVVTPNSVHICKNALARLRRTKQFRADMVRLKSIHQQLKGV